MATSLLCLLRELLQGLLGDGEHSAGAAGAVVEQIGPGFDLVGDRQEDEIGHQLDRIARRPVLTGLFVVFLVEPPNQLLEDRAHGVVVETWMLDGTVTVEDRLGTKIDIRGEKLFDQRPERVSLGKAWDLIAKFEIVEDFLHVRREAVEIGFKVCLQLLLAAHGSADREV